MSGLELLLATSDLIDWMSLSPLLRMVLPVATHHGGLPCEIGLREKAKEVLSAIARLAVEQIVDRLRSP